MESKLQLLMLKLKGGDGSGNFGHSGGSGGKGNPGGSSPKGGGGGLPGGGLSSERQIDSRGYAMPNEEDKKWFNSLSEEEKDVLVEYTSGGSSTINSKLGLGEELTEKEQKFVSQLDSIMSRAPKTTKEETFYRGLTPGIPISSGNIVSASRGNKTAGIYGSSYNRELRKFTVPKGTPVAPISMIGFENIAEEVILPRNTKIISEEIIK